MGYINRVNLNHKPKRSKMKNELKNEKYPLPVTQIPVTHCHVIPLKEPAGKTLAMVRVVLAGCFQLTALRIVRGTNGLFVSYPNDPTYKGDDYRSLFYPITLDQREYMEKLILAEYQKLL